MCSHFALNSSAAVNKERCRRRRTCAERTSHCLLWHKCLTKPLLHFILFLFTPVLTLWHSKYAYATQHSYTRSEMLVVVFTIHNNKNTIWTRGRNKYVGKKEKNSVGTFRCSAISSIWVVSDEWIKDDIMKVMSGAGNTNGALHCIPATRI